MKKQQDMLKIQTCVLRVNIHCEGCMHKVKKKLQKVEGVYKVSIDSEQGKVIVSGNADPATLIDKLEKAGKNAQLWGGPQKPVPVFISNHHQFNKFQLNNKGNHHEQHKPHKNGNGFLQIPQDKGFKDDKLFSAKDHKSVSFHLPREKMFDDDDGEFDDDDDEFDDDEEFDDEFDDDEEFDAHKQPAKASHNKGDKEGKGKKGGGIDVFLKGMLKKAGRKRGDSDKKSKKGEKMKEDGGKKGGFELGDFKKGKNEDGRIKKGGGESFHFDGGKKQQKQQRFHEIKPNHKAGGGGGRNMDMTGQKGGYPAMNGGRFMPNNPYSHQRQQQYMAHMMMNQNGQGNHHPSAYVRPPPPTMSYGPPPGMVYGPPPPMMYGPPHATTDHFSHMFSDENTGSCSIM